MCAAVLPSTPTRIPTVEELGFDPEALREQGRRTLRFPRSVLRLSQPRALVTEALRR